MMLTSRRRDMGAVWFHYVVRYGPVAGHKIFTETQSAEAPVASVAPSWCWDNLCGFIVVLVISGLQWCGTSMGRLGSHGFQYFMADMARQAPPGGLSLAFCSGPSLLLCRFAVIDSLVCKHDQCFYAAENTAPVDTGHVAPL